MGLTKETRDKIKKQREQQQQYYCDRSILGYWWAMFYILLGGREAGKSYAVTDTFCNQFKRYGRPFYWLRLSETSARKLLQNNAAKLVDPDLRRKYKLDLVTNADCVYAVTKRSKPDAQGKTKILEKKLMARVFSIATFYNDKGSGLFDKDFLDDPNMYYNICLDEMNREQSEKNTFDIVYNFTNQIENLVRSTKNRIRIVMIGNTLEEASDIMCAFNFIPEEFGRYKLVKNKKLLRKYLDDLEAAKTQEEQIAVNSKYAKIDFGKRAVVEYIEGSENYRNRRHGTVADILMPTASTFTNKIDVDGSLVYKGRCKSPTLVIKYSKDPGEWFTLWDGKCIRPFKGEKKPVISMRPYIDEVFDAKTRDQVISLFDARAYLYKDLITFKKFQKLTTLLKPRGA